MVNASLISRLSHAVDLIEERIQQNRPWKIVTVRRGLKEDPDAALDRHFAARPADRGANIVIWTFHADEEIADGARTVPRRAEPAQAKDPSIIRSVRNHPHVERTK
jgi:hypothetical protein